MPDSPPDPLAAELAAIRSRHQKVPDPSGDPAGICESDRHRWPCHAHLLGEAVAGLLKLADGAQVEFTTPAGDPLYWDMNPADIRHVIACALLGEEAGDV